MGKFGFSQLLTACISIIGMGSFVSFSTIPPALSETPSNTATPHLKQASNNLSIHYTPSATYQGAPTTGRRRGGASRGTCYDTPLPLTAIVPASADNELSSSGVTVSSNPTFWFYVPYVLSEERPVEFSLLDQGGNYVYRTRFSGPTTTAGIIQVKLPETVTLEPSQPYNWTLQILCQANTPITVWGGIERVLPTPDLAAELRRTTDPIALAALYAEHGIWYDALTTLGDLHVTNQSDAAIASHWASLLKSVDLAEISNEPPVPCCLPQ